MPVELLEARADLVGDGGHTPRDERCLEHSFLPVSKFRQAWTGVPPLSLSIACGYGKSDASAAGYAEEMSQ
jgi:hypothetical protein